MIRLLAWPAAALLSLSLALPALAAPGLRLSWDHCSADGRVANKAFACDTNAGSQLLVASYEPPVAKLDCVGLEMVFHIKSSSNVMPAWWQLAPTGACRANVIVHDLTPEAAGSCEFPYGTQGAGGIAGFLADAAGTGSWRFLALTAVPSPQTWAVHPGQEYFAIGIRIQNMKTVGTGACSGCSEPVCIGFGSARLVDAGNVSVVDILAGGPNNGGGNVAATWQGAYVRDYTVFRDLSVVRANMTCDPDNSVPTRGSTWGAVKSLYR